MNVILIDCEDSYTLNIYDYLCRIGISVAIISYAHFEADWTPSNIDAVLFSPGPNEATSYPKLLSWLEKHEKDVAVLGICLGHQIIGHYYGHFSMKAKKALHGVPMSIVCEEHPLFGFLKSKTMQVMPYHSLVVNQNSSSPLQILATNTDSEIMAFAHKHLPIAGFQFHPESIGTPLGLDLLKAWKEWVVKK